MRQDYHLFKLNRMMDPKRCRGVFGKRILPPYENEADHPFPTRFPVRARCKPSIEWRIVDELGTDTLGELLDDNFMFTIECSDKENLFCRIPSLGDQIELLEPGEFWAEFAELGCRIYNIYRQTWTNL